MVQWLVALLVAVCPPGKVPERETRDAALIRYESIAEDILAEVHAAPLYSGLRGEAASAALVAAVAIHESGLRLDVDEGLTRGEGQDLLADRQRAARVALHMMRTSLKRSGTLCGYTGEAAPCPKARQRLEFARDYLRAHPFDGGAS